MSSFDVSVASTGNAANATGSLLLRRAELLQIGDDIDDVASFFSPGKAFWCLSRDRADWADRI